MSDELAHEIEHLLLALRVTDNAQFVELCDLLSVDPKQFGEFLADDARSRDN